MTTPEIDKTNNLPEQKDEKEERKRRTLLLILLLLLLLLCCAGFLFLRYLLKPEPITEIIPGAQVVNYPPQYVYSISGADAPVGVAVSPDGGRLYVTESGGERLVKVFSVDGDPLFEFAPPGTTSSSRALSYVAVDPTGQVFLVDHMNNVIDIFDADGNFIDAIIDRDMTISKYLAQNLSGGLPDGTTFYYIGSMTRTIFYTLPGGEEQSLKVPEVTSGFGPLGVRFDQQGSLMYTDLAVGQHAVHVIPQSDLQKPWVEFAPSTITFGTSGKEAGQFEFPQVVVQDSRGDFYVTDGNNGRISAWTSALTYRSFFAFGSSESSLNLPRGLWMSAKDHLHVADAVGSTIRVYDVSGENPVFLFNFGEFGVGEGFFNYPYDICMDGTGRLYIADRGNNRIQVWSY